MSQGPLSRAEHGDERLETVIANQATQGATLALILSTLNKVLKMSETATQALADIQAIETQEVADLATLNTTVTALLAAFAAEQAAGTLTAAQQTSLNALKAAMGVDDASIQALNASEQAALTPAAPATP